MPCRITGGNIVVGRGYSVPEGVLGDRGKALEEQFFARQDEELKRQLRERRRADDARESLAAALDVDPSAVPDELIALDLSPESVAAFAMVPLVVVAWADGQIDEKERSAILAAAEQAHVEAGSPSYKLLADWLQRQPPSTLIDAWNSYAAAISESVGDEAREEIRRDVIHRARAVAEATGGILGFGSKVSTREEQALLEIEGAFQRGPS
jgi:hypothetical protein